MTGDTLNRSSPEYWAFHGVRSVATRRKPRFLIGPPRKHPPSQLDIYEKYLCRRWAEGGRAITTLWKELQQQGYPGKRKNVVRYLKRFQKNMPFRSTRKLAWLFMKDASELQDEEKVQLLSVLEESPNP